MNIEKIAAVYEACRRAREAQLDAFEAADAAGLPIALVTEDQIVEVERAAVRALVEAVPANPGEAERRDEILMRVACTGDHTDVLPAHLPVTAGWSAFEIAR
ncbi:hypothetical protein AFEL58S_01623 [Afipia felis]